MNANESDRLNSIAFILQKFSDRLIRKQVISNK